MFVSLDRHGRAIGPPKQTTNNLQYVFFPQRLVVNARPEANDLSGQLVVNQIIASDNGNWDFRKAAHHLETPKELDAVDNRKMQIEKDDIRDASLDFFQCCPRVVRRAGLVSVPLQHRVERLDGFAIVVNDQHRRLIHR